MDEERTLAEIIQELWKKGQREKRRERKDKDLQIEDSHGTITQGRPYPAPSAGGNTP